MNTLRAKVFALLFVRKNSEIPSKTYALTGYSNCSYNKITGIDSRVMNKFFLQAGFLGCIKGLKLQNKTGVTEFHGVSFGYLSIWVLSALTVVLVVPLD